jgi:outer membrane lipoprotein SlyB
MLAAALTLSLAGCQTPPSGPGASLAADPSDPCQSDRAAFASSKTFFQDQIVSGAVTGAAAGAGLGALTGLAATGNWRGALIGGLAGGAVGGVVGGSSAYYKTLSEHARDQDELAYNMNQDLTRESQEIDHTAATFGRLRACRFGQAEMVKDQARAHLIDRQTALLRIAYHRDKFNEELNIAHQFGLTMARRSQEFQQAANELATRPPVTPQGSAAPATRAAPARVAQVDKAATVSVPEKRQSFDNTVASAQASSKAAFDLDSNAKLSLLQQSAPDA